MWVENNGNHEYCPEEDEINFYLLCFLPTFHAYGMFVYI